MLAEYPGTVLLVSHDRDFLDRVVTSVIAAEGGGRWVEYAGGYTDMLAQRGPVPAAVVAAAARPRPVTEPRPQQAVRARRMTFKDRHALATLPAEIATLQAEVGDLNSRLADPDLYARDPARFGAITKALGVAQAALAAAEERWLDARDAARGDRGLIPGSKRLSKRRARMGDLIAIRPGHVRGLDPGSTGIDPAIFGCACETRGKKWKASDMAGTGSIGPAMTTGRRSSSESQNLPPPGTILHLSGR